MTHPELRERACNANRALAGTGLVLGTFGNVSAVDREAGVMAIKPSGVAYELLTPAHMVVVDLATGVPVDSALRPSSDAPTHLVLYGAFPRCGGIAHTHSTMATALAQARQPIRCLGTTHADHFRGDVPVTRAMREDEVATDYEANTGHVIVETFVAGAISPDDVPAVLVANHGPFVWGPDPATAVEHATILEFLARMEVAVRLVAPDAPRPAAFLVDKHFLRKHGAGAYYGQQTRDTRS